MIKLLNITARKATIKDIKDIIVMAYDFYVEFVMGKHSDFDFEFIGKSAANIIIAKDMEIFVIHDPEKGLVGMVYTYLAPAYYNPKIKIAEAHQLYLKPEYRETSAIKVMLNCIKEWAKNKGTFWLRQSVVKDKMKYKIYKGGKSCQWHQQSQQV